VSNVATDWLDAANRHVPTLSLNARRKFFHALAVVMFLPGLVVDPAFTHLSFSAAFALFTFAEYVRYFALYPFGASVHVFMNEFLDQKDSGTAILSHFYLLIGCAGSVWFEGPSQLLQYTGTLVLGVGDALASIVGKRFGRHRWLATSPKTVEGSAAFVVSVVACAWLLRVCGLAESFSMARYTSVAVLSALLEAFSVQNDNVVLPLYMWSMLVFTGIVCLAAGARGRGPVDPLYPDRAGSAICSVNMLPSPFDPSPADDQVSALLPAHERGEAEIDYDWATFVNAYALGRWDPLRTPNPPRSHLQAPCHPRASRVGQEAATDDSVESAEVAIYPSSTIALQGPQSAPLTQPAQGQDPGESRPPKRLSVPFTLGAISHRLRNSFTDLRPGPSMEAFRHPAIPATDATTSAAAIRWAAARVSVAPLALPSPEHELTDPMRGVTATIPGSHPPEHSFLVHADTPLASPGGVRKSRLSSFWQGTQDVDDPRRLPTIQQSPPDPESDEHTGTHKGDNEDMDYNQELLEEDYFGSMDPSRLESLAGAEDHRIYAPSRTDHPDRQISAPPFEMDPMTVPALPRRICLTRQTSAPLPTSTLYERRMRATRPASESFVANLAGRAAKEEQMYSELGYLAPPNPPKELERRRALYKFNIWGTGRDPNFDRIVHLVKLVFNTKIVTISLIDGTEELPLVLGEPRIRFYAGCPLRTQDGYNIGSLSIIDDTPRREFSPRQRHTLKEFAQIAMRELELWRDKIQLRIRDRIQSSMEQFTRECLDLDKEAEVDKGLFIGTSMEQVYERAARLVKRTLDIEGAMVLDVSHVDVLETVGAESTMSITLHSADRQAGTATSSKLLSRDEYDRLAEFFARNPEGKICEGVVPTALRPFLPARIQYALGVIILSAVLKRRMILADKAKSLFISNISHELRTPLHGILASAELLSDTNLDHSQASFLHTVQACGTSLVETVNHVLDFTKLSGNSRSGGVGHAIHHSKVDLMQLVEEATEGCWIGHRARMFTSEIGSVYSPPKHDSSSAVLACPPPQHVETVIDIGNSKSVSAGIDVNHLILRLGWTFLCEKGGIRRVLMNVFGNSLKFTSDGFVHVMLRQLPPTSDTPKGKVKIEMSVIDTGKGISQNFLKNQLFHPFSQENPLQTGTGLGLAIVNSIVRSSSVDGKVDVWSAEGVGTEIKITFNAEAVEDEDVPTSDEELKKVYAHLERPTISLIGFNEPHRGVQLLRSVVKSYLVSRWDFVVAEEDPSGQIIVANEDLTPVANAVENKQSNQPFIILSSLRGDPRLMNTVSEYERIGGFCRIVYKPVGPVRLYSALKMCLHVLNMEKRPNSSPTLPKALASASAVTDLEDGIVGGTFPRRFSEENNVNAQRLRPSLGPRAATVHPLASWSHMTLSSEPDGIEPEPPDQVSTAPNSPNSSTVSVGAGGTLLKSSVGALGVQGPVRVLVIEDNNILRGLLIKWLRNKGYDYREAVDGQEGVHIFETEGHFDVVLVDLSMPVLDGVGATTQMRSIEMTRTQGAGLSQSQSGKAHSASILALTGMSSLEDKRRAFEAGVDGYLVKPVAFKTLDTLFHKLGVVS
ncbi:histidine kinase, partial [Wolfiporia cocos MD-104 SS10]